MALSATAASDPSSRATLPALDYVVLILLVIGGLNWLLVGAFDFDLVAFLLGRMSIPARIVYVVVGLCAIYTLIMMARWRRR